MWIHCWILYSIIWIIKLAFFLVSPVLIFKPILGDEDLFHPLWGHKQNSYFSVLWFKFWSSSIFYFFTETFYCFIKRCSIFHVLSLSIIACWSIFYDSCFKMLIIQFQHLSLGFLASVDCLFLYKLRFSWFSIVSCTFVCYVSRLWVYIWYERASDETTGLLSIPVDTMVEKGHFITAYKGGSSVSPIGLCWFCCGWEMEGGGVLLMLPVWPPLTIWEESKGLVSDAIIKVPISLVGPWNYCPEKGKGYLFIEGKRPLNARNPFVVSNEMYKRKHYHWIFCLSPQTLL
jgi:hypothetical protein